MYLHVVSKGLVGECAGDKQRVVRLSTRTDEQVIELFEVILLRLLDLVDSPKLISAILKCFLLLSIGR
jgi:hypothetical protein